MLNFEWNAAQLGEKEITMKKTRIKKRMSMRTEYDFSKGIRGKYFKRYQKGTNLIALSSDVRKVFPNSEAVNNALRQLIKTAQKATKSVNQ